MRDDTSEKKPSNTAIGITTLLLGVTILLFLGTVWGLASEYTKNHLNAEYQARKNREDTDRRIGQRCASLPAPDSAYCIADAIRASREDQRSEQNLEAQRNTATWTGAMASLAAFGLLLSAGGVFLVYTTFRETRKAVATAQRNLESFIRVEDASLIVSFPSGHAVSGTVNHYSLKTCIANVGRSAALIHSIRLADEDTVFMSRILDAGAAMALEDFVRVEKVDGAASTLIGCIEYSTALSERAELTITGVVLLDKTRVPWALVTSRQLKTPEGESKTTAFPPVASPS